MEKQLESKLQVFLFFWLSINLFCYLMFATNSTLFNKHMSVKPSHHSQQTQATVFKCTQLQEP